MVSKQTKRKTSVSPSNSRSSGVQRALERDPTQSGTFPPLARPDLDTVASYLVSARGSHQLSLRVSLILRGAVLFAALAVLSHFNASEGALETFMAFLGVAGIGEILTLNSYRRLHRLLGDEP